MVTATPTGFRQQIVIRQRPAQPVSFRIPVDLPQGLSIGKGDKGQPTLKTEDGKTFLDIRPAPLLDAVAADPSGDLDAAKVGRAAVTVDGSDLVYSPDPAFLAEDLTWSNQPSVTNTGAYNSDNCTGSFNYEWNLIHSVNTIVQEWANGEPNYGFQLTAGNESDITNWRRYRTRESTYPYPAHAPRLSVDFEPPAPPRQDTVVISSPTLMGTFPEYEEALQRSVFVPETDADLESVGLTPEVADKAAAKRDGQPFFVGSDIAPADNSIHAGQAAREYAWRTPPSRSRRRTFRSMIGSGTVRSGAAWFKA